MNTQATLPLMQKLNYLGCSYEAILDFPVNSNLERTNVLKHWWMRRSRTGTTNDLNVVKIEVSLQTLLLKKNNCALDERSFIDRSENIFIT